MQGSDLAQPAREDIGAALRAGEACEVIIRNYRKDGSPYWNGLNLTPVRDSTGDPTYYIGVQRDVSAIHDTLQRLARSEASLNEAQATAHLGSWDLDLRTGELLWSDETYRLLGYAPGAVPASIDAFFAVVTPEQAAAVRAAIEAAFTHPDGHYQIEHPVQGPDGVRRILREEGRAYLDETGQRLRLSGTCLDITEQRAIEDDLRRQEERYRLVVEHIEDLVVRTDGEGRFSYVSPSYCALFGRTESELIGRQFMPLVHPDDLAETEAGLRRLIDPPHTCRVEQRAETALGWRWLQWVDRAILDETGRIKAIVGIGRDITERKEAERALSESESRFREVVENIREVVWVMDWSTREVIYVSPAFEWVWERTLEELNAEPTIWQGSLHPEDVERVLRRFDPPADAEEVSIEEYRILTPSGRVKTILDRAYRVLDAAGAVIRVIGVISDVTERRTVERSLENERRRVSDIIEGTRIGIWEWNIDTGDLFVNGRWASMLG
jgi:PAS domain S-box-containing protein